MQYFTSCLCCSLRTGSKVIAIYAIIAGFLVIGVASMLFLYKEDPFWSKEYQIIPSETFIYLLIFTILGQIVNFLLLFGVLKRIGGLMIPWLFLFAITLVLEFLEAIIYFVWGEFSTGIGYLLGIALSYLMFHCVLSYYKELQQKTPNNVEADRDVFTKV